MSITDPVADMLTKIRNGLAIKHEKVDIRPSKLKVEIIKILKSEGYVKNYKKVVQDNVEFIRIYLKYGVDENSIIHGLKLVSSPGRRVYSGYKTMPRVFNGFGTVIVSTSTGITTGRKATARKVGGEIICKVW